MDFIGKKNGMMTKNRKITIKINLLIRIKIAAIIIEKKIIITIIHIKANEMIRGNQISNQRNLFLNNRI